jgi:hypothetical protein
VWMASPVEGGQALSMQSARPTQAESGKPPVSAFPRHIMSGTTPTCSQANHLPGTTETGVDLVQNQECAVFLAQRAQTRKEAWRWEC